MYFFFSIFGFETRFYYVAQGESKLIIQHRLASNWQSSCLSLQRADIVPTINDHIFNWLIIYRNIKMSIFPDVRKWVA